MQGNSRAVNSSQQGCHDQLERVVQKHLQHRSQRPPAPHSLAAFADVRDRIETRAGALVFDSFCGTGMSTALLAQRHPDCLVVGIDKSAHRLGKHTATEGDYLLVQADCVDWWQLAVDAGWRLRHHYLLYPNPWPKPGQLKRRVHGSPAFADVLRLGGAIELRSNWQTYVEEFAQALRVSGHTASVEELSAAIPLSLFERKYADSKHQLWRCLCQLGDNGWPGSADPSMR